MPTEHDTTNREIAQRLDYLAGRWSDEEQYENFSNYETHMKAFIESKSGVFISMKKRPFEVKYKLDLTTYVVQIKGSKINIFIED
jgi:hypothetical protein